MVEADREARSLSARSTNIWRLPCCSVSRWRLISLTVSSAPSFSPFMRVTAVSKELGEGKLDQVVPVMSNDELGQLADAFNKMATKLRAYRQRH